MTYQNYSWQDYFSGYYILRQHLGCLGHDGYLFDVRFILFIIFIISLFTNFKKKTIDERFFIV